MSIHSPIFYCLSRYRAAEKTLPLLGRTLAFPSQQRYNLASVSWMRSGVSSQLDMPETPNLTRRHFSQMAEPPKLASLEVLTLYLTESPDNF